VPEGLAGDPLALSPDLREINDVHRLEVSAMSTAILVGEIFFGNADLAFNHFPRPVPKGLGRHPLTDLASFPFLKCLVREHVHRRGRPPILKVYKKNTIRRDKKGAC
jgi:hypothetical protein